MRLRRAVTSVTLRTCCTRVVRTGARFCQVFNLIWELPSDNFLRFSAARTVARARMDQMRASFVWDYNEQRETGTTPVDGPWSGGGGNPEVNPWVANAFDLSWEKYFADGVGYFSLAYFYKDIEEFIIELPEVRDFSEFPGTRRTESGHFRRHRDNAAETVKAAA